ncbi:hypothetical protein APHAL10511_000896 [Amanita phalloides]|nr:hypothetical protein APHAL10511_000896 [Amanita phalloides]
MTPSHILPARPCPFYQHGRCLFADSCNFLHTVSVRPSSGVTIIHSPRNPDQTISHNPPNPPILTVESPRSASSPPRSPRLSGLLHALRDVIGDDPDDGFPSAASEKTPDTSNTAILQEGDDTLVTEAQDCYVMSNSSVQEGDAEGAYSAVAFSDESAVPSRISSPSNRDRLCGADNGGSGQDGVEDDEHFRRDVHARNLSDVLPESMEKRRSMSGLRNRSSMNRPSHLQLESLVPPIIDPSAKDSEVVIDSGYYSGYAESWHPHSSLTLTPPRTPSTLNLLASPFGSPSVRVHSQIGIINRFSMHSATEDDAVSEISLDCTADCSSPRHELRKAVPNSELATTNNGNDADDNVLQSSSDATGSEIPSSVASSPEMPSSDVSSSDAPVSTESPGVQLRYGARLDNEPNITYAASEALYAYNESPKDVEIETVSFEPAHLAAEARVENKTGALTRATNSAGTYSFEPVLAADTNSEHKADVLTCGANSAETNFPECSFPSDVGEDATGTSTSANSNVPDAPPISSPRNVEMDLFDPVRFSPGNNNDITGTLEVAVDSLASDSVATLNLSDGEQPGAGTIFTENASAVWKAPAVHQDLSVQGAVVSFSQVDDNTVSAYAEDSLMSAYSHTSAVADLYTEDPTINGHTPDFAEDLGDDDNASSQTTHSSSRLAYLASPPSGSDIHQSLYDTYSNVASPPREAEHSSMHLQLESSTSFAQAFSDTSSIDAPPQEQVITTPAEAQKLVQAFIVSPAEPRPFSSIQNREPVMNSPPPRSVSSRSSTSSDTFESSRKVSFGWRGSRNIQSCLSDQSLSSRSSFIQTARGSNDTFSNRTSFNDRRADSAHGTVGGLRPLRLSTYRSQHNYFKPRRNSNGSYISHSRSGNRASISSSVSSAKSPSHNLLLSPTRISSIPEHIRNSILIPEEFIPSPLSEYSLHLRNFGEPRSAPVSPDNPWHQYEPMSFDRAPSSASDSALHRIDEQEDGHLEALTNSQVIPRPSISRRPSVLESTVHAIATPKPTLFFAIASDDVGEVRKVLEDGHAGPNEAVGPQSALEFALTNDQLTHKMEIVKLLLAYGANLSVVRKHSLKPKALADAPSDSRADAIPADQETGPKSTPDSTSKKTILDATDPATRYYVERAEAPDTRRASALMHRSSFRVLTRVRYEIVGQDRALEQLFKVLSIHTRHLSATPIVVLLCGPSGHGKSLLARKFGSLLDVPTHTVNMTTLKSTHDLWKSYSMSPYETPTTCTLAEFLINNEGKRCVVVLDEIEKTEDEKALWSLLMPWELGRCSIEAGSRHVDVKNVVWIGTSNIGHDIILEHQSARDHSQETYSQEEYAELMGLLRPNVSQRLGASVLSRVTTVLPFVPFTLEEQKAICSEAMYMLAGEGVRELPPQAVEKIIDDALGSYCAKEGARSLYRAISRQLVDNI